MFWLDDALRARHGRRQTPFLTRLHVRYDAAHFPEDLVFQETADRTNFQGRYVHPPPVEGRRGLPGREGLPRSRCASAAPRRPATWRRSPDGTVEAIRSKMAVNAEWVSPEDEQKWWDRIWK